MKQIQLNELNKIEILSSSFDAWLICLSLSYYAQHRQKGKSALLQGMNHQK